MSGTDSGPGPVQRLGDWLSASDPGLLRLQMAVRTTLTLSVTLVVLYLLTRATGELKTVALLGVVIAMMSAMAVGDPDPRQRKITMTLLPLPTAASVTLDALLAPHVVVGDAVFVLIVYARRFGGRGMALGMVAFMTHFFALFLGATVGKLPWLIGAVVDATTDALRSGRLDEQHRRHLRSRVTRLNQMTLMAESQLDDKVDAAALWPGVGDDELSLRLFDVELTTIRWVTYSTRWSRPSMSVSPSAPAHPQTPIVAPPCGQSANSTKPSLRSPMRTTDRVHLGVRCSNHE